MIHYAGVTAYNEVQSDTPVAVDNGGSGGTGLTTFLERRVVVAIREVTRRDPHEGGPASREGTDRGDLPAASLARPPAPPTGCPPGRRPRVTGTSLGRRASSPQGAPGTCAVRLWGDTPSLLGSCPVPCPVRVPSRPPPRHGAGPGVRLVSPRLPSPRALRVPPQPGDGNQ